MVASEQPQEELKETRILNRVIRLCDRGWEYEPDQRHVVLILRALKLEKANGVTTLNGKLKPWDEEEDSKHEDQE